MFKYRLLTVLAVSGVLLLSCGKKGEDKQAKSLFPDSLVDSEVIANVNGYPIEGREVRLFSAVFLQSNRSNLPKREFNMQILDKLIDRVLVWQEAVANGIAIDDSSSNAALEKFIDKMGGQSKIDDFLVRMNFNRDALMTSLRQDLVIREFLEDSFASRVHINEDTVRAYYKRNRDRFVLPDSVRARHILIRVLPSDDEETKKQKLQDIEVILKRIRAGEDFGKLAELYSDDPSTRDKGGDLGFFPKNTMVAAFDSVAFNLKKGQVSDVVETKYGYHIIKVEGKKKGKVLRFNDVKDNLKAGMWEYELGNMLAQHLDKLRKSADIKRNY